jgi:hypothetical protein
MAATVLQRRTAQPAALATAVVDFERLIGEAIEHFAIRPQHHRIALILRSLRRPSVTRCASKPW